MANMPFWGTNINHGLHHVILRLQWTTNLFRSLTNFYITGGYIHDCYLSKYRLRLEIVLIFRSLACFFLIIIA